ncbi:DltD N-terminal domain protein [Poronia punctata]|nr:DltD N-terminal domain protein [Poronia punctata]
MDTPRNSEEVEFKTLDGLTLRGTLYPAAGSEPGPAIVMTPGFNLTRRTLMPKIAVVFQGNGVTALAYDPRTLGSSDGVPRNNIHPGQQVSDYHDAVTFLKSDPRVDQNKIAIWGMSFSGAVALSAAALDPRVRLIIAVCPLTTWELPENRSRGVMSKAMQDRESQITGNKPLYLPMINLKGENPTGFGAGSGAQELHLVQRSLQELPDFEINTTIQTYYNIRTWNPFHTLRLLSQTPTILITPEEDRISLAEKQKDLIYEKLTGPRFMHVVPGKGHMDIFDGESFGSTMQMQVDFIRRHLSGLWGVD